MDNRSQLFCNRPPRASGNGRGCWRNSRVTKVADRDRDLAVIAALPVVRPWLPGLIRGDFQFERLAVPGGHRFRQTKFEFDPTMAKDRASGERRAVQRKREIHSARAEVRQMSR